MSQSVNCACQRPEVRDVGLLEVAHHIDAERTVPARTRMNLIKAVVPSLIPTQVLGRPVMVRTIGGPETLADSVHDHSRERAEGGLCGAGAVVARLRKRPRLLRSSNPRTPGKAPKNSSKDRFSCISTTMCSISPSRPPQRRARAFAVARRSPEADPYASPDTPSVAPARNRSRRLISWPLGTVSLRFPGCEASNLPGPRASDRCAPRSARARACRGRKPAPA